MGFALSEEIFLDSDDRLVEGYWQPLEYPKFWYYCYYHMVGHMENLCKKKNNKNLGDPKMVNEHRSDTPAAPDKDNPITEKRKRISD